MSGSRDLSAYVCRTLSFQLLFASGPSSVSSLHSLLPDETAVTPVDHSLLPSVNTDDRGGLVFSFDQSALNDCSY